MVRIIADTSTLYNSSQAEEAGFYVNPLSVTIAGKSYKEFDEISAEEFVSIIRQGHMPTSSQPSIGDVAEMFDRFPNDDIINISLADGLSGTYNSAVAATNLCSHPDRITVLNTHTLCGPHRHLVEKAAALAKEGKSRGEILAALHEIMGSDKSFLLPADFDYLRRGGRLSPLVSYVGKAAHLTPVLTQTDDGSRLTIAAVRRGFAHGFKYVAEAMVKHGVGAGWKVYVVHADATDSAQKALDTMKAYIPDAQYEVHPLSPAFITQGGPGCVAIQAVKI